ncbi:MAG: hypothetical protein LBC97_03415 [Bifidobacteriaceae bacterium]|nr:hypothetical protein [Bifidobacteriaceae bacterium]
MTKKGWIAAGVTVAVLAGAAVGAVWWGKARNADGKTKEAEVRTAPVERTSLTSGLELRGTLAFGEPEELAGAAGIVTKLPEAGSIHKVGEPILEVEGSPVFLLQGEIPLWRDLSAGMSGIDVDTLRQGLVALGYSAGSTAAANPYDSALAGAIDALYAAGGYPAPSTRPDAVKLREEANQELAAARQSAAAARQALAQARSGPSGQEKTAATEAVNAAERALTKAKRCSAEDRNLQYGTGGECDVEAAQGNLNSSKAALADLNKPVDTSAEQAAVTSAEAALAAAQTKADQAALSAVGPKDILIVPTAEMRVDQVLARIGQSAEGPVVSYTDTTVFANVDLTDAQKKLLVTGSEVEVTLPDGTVLAGVVAEVTPSRQDPNTWETIPARARVDMEDQATLTEAGLSGVTIAMIQDQAADALVVPVTALLALSEGGYAVELKGGGLVGVEVGLIQDTRAQITPTTGDLEEGDLVVIA